MPAASKNRSSARRARRQPVAAAAESAPTSNGTWPAGDVPWLVVRGARQNNLKGIDVAFPLGRFTCVTGVSGSGKSSLVNDILHLALARDLNGAQTTPGVHDRIEIVVDRDALALPGGQTRRRSTASVAGRGAAPVTSCLDKIIAIDQSPIGRTPRSNPATYIKVFDEIRSLFSRLPDALLRGYKPGRFSFNVPVSRGGGRCEACEGNGSNRIEMDFLADVWVRCPVCEGRRFGRETLQIRFKGRSVADVLGLEVREALELFENIPRLRSMLQTLHDVGLDYIQLGQSSTTLSGGEAQRIKLARELVKRPTGRTLYVLDEPTTGLHFDDIRKLLDVLHSFVDAGNTVVVIEHNLDVLKTADWIIDLGPEGGDAGGRIVAEGTPEDVAASEGSYTGQALRGVLRPSEGWRVASNELAGEPEGVEASRVAAVSRYSPLDTVTVVGARQHNLKDLTVSFPRDRMTVCTGVSGSGKTSFAIDTVFTEGYRRYVESLSAYARQFLGQMTKPRVDHVEGLSPAICIEQRSAGHSPRSTVGTVTEIYDYMRVLWARVGERYCPQCHVPIGTQTADEIVARVMLLDEGAPIVVLAPVSLGSGETYAGLFQRLKTSGYTRVRIDGEIRLTAQATTLDARQKHRVEVVVDRTVVRGRSRGRIAESVEHALALGNGVMVLLIEAVETVEESGSASTPPGAALESGASLEGATSPVPDAAAEPAATAHRVRATPAREQMFSQKLVCLSCGTSYEDLGPNHFSFNSQLGWCETCEGLGVQRGAPAGEIIRRPERTLFDGALAGWPRIERRTPLGRMLVTLCDAVGVSPETPLRDWSGPQKRTLLFGMTGDWLPAAGALAGVRFQWRGLFPAIDLATRNSWGFRYRLRNVVTDIPCITCRGGRLRPDSAAVRLGADEFSTPGRQPVSTGDSRPATVRGRTIVQVCEMPLQEAAAFFRDLRLDRRQRQIAGELLKEIQTRLQFLIDVGLHYLTLHRGAPTLAGGEAQRIRLASQIGSGLSGVLYVLDEPTIGLHPRDTARLVQALVRLRDLGNTLLLVEHDRDVIRSADRLLDFGPRAGAAGGQLVAQGTPAEMLSVAPPAGTGESADAESLTRGYLSGRLAIPIPTNRRPVDAAMAARLAAAERKKAEAPPEAPSEVVFEPDPDLVPVSSPKSSRKAAAEGSARVSVHPIPVDTTGQRPVVQITDQRPAPPVPGEPSAWLVVRGGRQNNLKDLHVPIPLQRFVCVTGVSGSGKSSLVNDIVWPGLANELHDASHSVGEHDCLEVHALPREIPEGRKPGQRRRRSTALELTDTVDRAILVDQSPIGTTPASNPATYTGVFDTIRELFARLPDSKMRGYTANRFSFNRPGGRCEACEGYGQRRIEMHFMPDVWVECETCRGRRYSHETLEVHFKGRSIADVLEMRVGDALNLFENVPRVRRMLQTLADVGLDYVQLGQPAPTLSGGEAQRVKLASELGKPDTGRTLYVLDEPTTGLHFDDIHKLLAVIQRLVDLGNTAIVVEHNLDVLKCADWIIDLGPEAGEEGGWIVAMGTPEGVASSELRVTSCPGTRLPRASTERGPQVSSLVTLSSPLATRSHTAVALAPVLAAGPYEQRKPAGVLAVASKPASPRGEFGDIGGEVKLPWQVDGRKWHLEQRVSRGERPRHWEPAALEYVLELVHKAGAFEPTNWASRASVEVTAAGADMWFMHALTGGEWLLELYFRSPPGKFDWRKLNAQIGLKTLDEREDLEAYGDWARVDVRPRQDGWDAVVVYVHDREEIDTPAFRRFVREVVRAYLTGVGQQR